MIAQPQLQQIQSSQDSIHPQDFQNANALVQSIAQPRDSQPTKNKVKNFKNRVFQLLKIYSDKSHDVNLLVSCFKQDMFFKQPEKMNQLINSILNKQNIKMENLQQLLQYYRIILLYKSQKKNTDKLSLDFIRILKKVAQANNDAAKDVIIGMLKSFAFERKCTLKINFFFYLLRKYQNSGQELKQSIIDACKEYMNDAKLRNAQKKQLGKLLGKLDKSYRVQNKIKREQIQSDQENEQQKDVVAVKKQNKGKQTKRQNKDNEKADTKKEDDKKQEQNQGRLQKLKRIKQDKKKRKGSQNKQQPQQQNNGGSNNNNQNNKNNKNNNHSHSHEKKPQQQQQNGHKNEHNKNKSVQKTTQSNVNKTNQPSKPQSQPRQNKFNRNQQNKPSNNNHKNNNSNNKKFNNNNNHHNNKNGKSHSFNKKH